MFQSLHALGDLVRHQRSDIKAELGHRSTGVAACALLDELAALIATITDKVPADARPTRSAIMEYGDRAIAIMQSTQRTMDELAKLLDEGGAAVYQQRQPPDTAHRPYRIRRLRSRQHRLHHRHRRQILCRTAELRCFGTARADRGRLNRT